MPRHSPFIHLRARSSYSLLEGAIPVEGLVDLCKRHKMPALGLTDTGNLFGALEFSEKLAASGIQPIIGCALPVSFAAHEDQAASHKDPHAGKPPLLALLAQNQAGYQNLMQLSSLAYRQGQDHEFPHVDFEQLAALNQGLIVLTGGPSGPVEMALRARQDSIAGKRLGQLQDIFEDRLYIELQRHNRPDQQMIETALIDFAYEKAIPLVASNEPFFRYPGDYQAHDILICIAEGAFETQANRRRLTPEHWFKPGEDMAELFQDLPEALENTIEIARRCAYRPLTRDPILPKFASTTGLAEADELRRQATQGLKQRLKTQGLAQQTEQQEYHDRLDYELDVINGMDFPGYFLIVADFIKWAKARDIPVGPGRGSGAGSLVAYALTITDLDPLRFGLLFERFLNPERVSMPDFDIDFCQDRRDEVIHYVQDKYGADHVAQIITFGKLQARAVLRDVGRVLQMPYGQVDQLCKLVPNNPASPVTLAEAIRGEPRLQAAAKEEAVVEQLLTIGQKLEGLYRHASTHAAGVVIGDRPLEQLVPLYYDPRSGTAATQFSMKWAELAGLVKFDFLGLKTLTVLDRAVKLLQNRGVEIDLAKIPLDDSKTYELLGAGDTVGIFQLESSGMRDVLRKLHADCIEDIIALVALYRPGPMDNIPRFIACHNGDEPPDYLHPMLKPVLRETHGVIIYQEQVMQIAQILSGYSLGEADLLRRAMGKKIQSEMDQQKTRFIEGALARGVSQKQADHIFELVNKFAGYGFNKSHAAAYAIVAYQTAWLKANYPVEFMAASMTLDLTNTDKLAIFRQECDRLEIPVKAPDINRSQAVFSVHDGQIYYALAALKNVGRHAMEHLAEERRENGPYKDISGFARRINPRLVNKRALESLIRSGSFDTLDQNRARLFAGIEHILSEANREMTNKEQGMTDLFGADSKSEEPLKLPDAKPWPPVDQLANELEAVGFFLSGHPLDEYKSALRQIDVKTYKEFLSRFSEGQAMAKLAGTISYRQERRSRTGNRFAFIGLSDPSGQFEVTVFSDLLSARREQLEPGQSFVMVVEADGGPGEIRLRARSITPLGEALTKTSENLRIFVNSEAPLTGLASQLPKAGPKTTKSEIRLVLMREHLSCEIELRLPGQYAITPRVKSAIKAIPGIIQIESC